MKFKQPLSAERAAVLTDAKHPLMGKTNAEIDAYVDANVTNLADAKTLFKQMLKMQRNMMRRLANIN